MGACTCCSAVTGEAIQKGAWLVTRYRLDVERIGDSPFFSSELSWTHSLLLEMWDVSMPNCIEKNNEVKKWHVGVAAEAIAAYLFARCGLDVSVQYGANQPGYDLVVVSGDKLLKISVKGSRDGAWGLTQSFLKDADYKGAIAQWLKRHDSKIIFCLVQLKDIDVTGMLRVYLATPKEIADRLNQTRKGEGDTILYEYKKWIDGSKGAGTVDKLPESWLFSEQRVEEMLKNV